MKKYESTEVTNFTHEPFKKETYAETKLKINLNLSPVETHSFSLNATLDDSGEEPLFMYIDTIANYGIGQSGGSKFLYGGLSNLIFLCDGEQMEPESNFEGEQEEIQGGPHVVNFQRKDRFMFETSALIKIADAKTFQARGYADSIQYAVQKTYDFEQAYLDQFQVLVRAFLYDVLKHPLSTGDYQSLVNILLKHQNESRPSAGLFGFLKKLF